MPDANYENEAAFDDGSCLFEDALGVCGDDCPSDVDEDGICDDEDSTRQMRPIRRRRTMTGPADDDPMDPVEGFIGLVQEATPATIDGASRLCPVRYVGL